VPALKALPTLLALKGGSVVVLLIMGLVFYIIHTKTLKKLSIGACNGHPNKCLQNSFQVNRKMWIAKFNALVTGIKAEFMADFVKSNDEKHHINSLEVSRLVQRHGNLIDACFFKLFLNTEDVILNNHLPNPYKESSAESFEEVLRDYFTEDWKALWEKYKNEYDHNIFYLSLQGRIDKNEAMREEWFKAYLKMFKKVYKNRGEDHG